MKRDPQRLALAILWMYGPLLTGGLLMLLFVGCVPETTIKACAEACAMQGQLMKKSSASACECGGKR